MTDDEMLFTLSGVHLPLWPKRSAKVAGALDYVSADEGIYGWVIDMAEPETPLPIQLICGGEVIADGLTGIARPDVVSALSVTGMPGFCIPWSDIDILQIERIDNEVPDALIEVCIPSCNGRLQKSPDLKDVSTKDVLGYIIAARERAEAAARAADEKRREDLFYDVIGNVAPIGAVATAPSMPVVTVQIDTMIACRGGTILIVGWIDDRDNPLQRVHAFAGHDQASEPTAFGRVRRPDVDAVMQSHGHLFGFWTVMRVERALSADDKWVIRGKLAEGQTETATSTAKIVTEIALRTTILEYFATTEYFGSREIESFMGLEAGIGNALVAMNRRITDSIISGAWVSYYGPVRKSYLGSIIVCLFGKHEFMFLQTALFTLGPRAREYEFVYVSNSPELTETLEKEARLCARIYGVSIVLVCLPDNAGFGAANNIAARYARSSRLMITNPDVFPRDDQWAKRHAEIIEQAPVEQTTMFGVPLHYDDGSLMHHGMYFEVDSGISVRNDGVFARPMIRTEHYGKGAPVWAQYGAPRPVSAVTGAFISADRDWFEALGGFTEDFLFGHYEDCDLCLKSFSRGKPVWVQDLPLWHMEGKGSVRRRAHEGGILVNRWIFTKAWGELIARDLNGPAPQSLAGLAPEAAPVVQLRADTPARHAL